MIDDHTGINRLHAVIADIDQRRVGELPPHNDVCDQLGDNDCPACLIATIRQALDEYMETPVTADEIEPPCNHPTWVWVGTVSSEGFWDSGGRGMSCATCAECRVKSEGYITFLTGKSAVFRTYAQMQAVKFPEVTR